MILFYWIGRCCLFLPVTVFLIKMHTSKSMPFFFFMTLLGSIKSIKGESPSSSNPLTILEYYCMLPKCSPRDCQFIIQSIEIDYFPSVSQIIRHYAKKNKIKVNLQSRSLPTKCWEYSFLHAALPAQDILLNTFSEIQDRTPQKG